MTEDIAIRPFDLRASEAELLAVHALHFPGSDAAAKRREYISWLLSNPCEGSLYLAAYVDGKFASFLAFIAREVVGFGRVFRCALAAAAMTLPEFGGRALYRRLAHHGWDQAARAGFDVALGYTIRSYVLDLELRMGWARASVAPVVALPLDAPAVIRSAMPRLGKAASLSAILSPLARKSAELLANRVRLGDYQITRVDEIPPECDRLAERLRGAERLHFAKDRRTLTWLYRSPHNPFIYDIVEARQAGDMIGFAVGRRMDLLGLDGYGILDLIALPGHEAALAPLAAELVLNALANSPQIVGALVSAGHPAKTALHRLGFLNTGRSFTLIYRPLRTELPEMLSQPQNWCNFWGNNDTV